MMRGRRRVRGEASPRVARAWTETMFALDLAEAPARTMRQTFEALRRIRDERAAEPAPRDPGKGEGGE